MFNPKAWSNTDLMLEWIKHIYTPSSFIPGGTTGFVQICDTVVNFTLVLIKGGLVC